MELVKRKIFQLEIEKEALRKEKDEPSSERLKVLERDLSNLKDKDKEMTAKYERKRDIL